MEAHKELIAERNSRRFLSGLLLFLGILLALRLPLAYKIVGRTKHKSKDQSHRWLLNFSY